MVNSWQKKKKKQLHHETTVLCLHHQLSEKLVPIIAQEKNPVYQIIWENIVPWSMLGRCLRKLKHLSMGEALKSDSCKDLESGCISSAKTKVHVLNNNNNNIIIRAKSSTFYNFISRIESYTERSEGNHQIVCVQEQRNLGLNAHELKLKVSVS